MSKKTHKWNMCIWLSFTFVELIDSAYKLRLNGLSVDFPSLLVSCTTDNTHNSIAWTVRVEMLIISSHLLLHYKVRENAHGYRRSVSALGYYQLVNCQSVLRLKFYYKFCFCVLPTTLIKKVAWWYWYGLCRLPSVYN